MKKRPASHLPGSKRFLFGGCALALSASLILIPAGSGNPAYAAELPEETTESLASDETDMNASGDFRSNPASDPSNTSDLLTEENSSSEDTEFSIRDLEIVSETEDTAEADPAPVKDTRTAPSLEVTAMEETDDTGEILSDYAEVICGSSGIFRFDETILNEEFEYLADWDEVLQDAQVTLVYSSLKPEVISITEDGAYQANKVGLTKITVTADYTLTFASEPEEEWPEDDPVTEDPELPDDPEPETRTVTGTSSYTYHVYSIPNMTNVRFTSSSKNLFIADNNCTNDGTVKVTINSGDNGTYKFTDGNNYTNFYLESYKYYDPYLYYTLDKNVLTIHTYQAGHNSLVFNLNGKKLTLKLHSYKLKLNTSVLLMKGASKTLKVSGLPTGTKVTWSIGSKTTGSISSAGKVTGKAVGATYVTAKVGNVKLCTVLNVTGAAAYKAIQNGKKIGSGTYSQPKRMQTGYYDCSSLVWRSYSPYGYYFGSKNWAPTAAAEAEFLASKKKIFLTEGQFTYDKINKLKPARAGDLLFLTGYNNGRYKGIYHVEMMGGYRFAGYDWDGKATATMTYVTKSDGWYDGWQESIVGHPVKG